VAAEFGMKWSHKRSAGGTVTKWDCVVCHMEGDPATGDRSAVHMDGVVNLRDPDVGTNIKGVTFSGTPAPGSYASTATDVTFTAFRRDLGVTLENDPNFLTLAAIQINQCLKCHDVDGARAFDPGNPLNVMASADGVTRSAAIPFGTAISYASVPAAEGGTTSVPSGAGITAGGVPGGVIDVNASLATGNSSYHPVRGKQNNWYAKDARMFAPWDMGVPTRSGTVNTTTWGPLLSCWDCHALPTDSGPIDSTVTAHGGTATLRGNGAATTTSAPTATTGATLCWVCHKGYNASGSSHGTGSALSGSTNSQMTVYLQYGCNRCHSSNYTTVVVRPVRAQDVHGFDRLAGTGADALWPVGTTETRKPYAFIRNTTSLSDHQPASIGGTTYTATCVHLNDTPCNSRTESYSVGGTY
jgi:hypothetical protein